MSRPSTPPTRPEISLTQVASSALAAASATFAASYLGVTGTIIGAALGSVVATVAGATYAASLHRSRDAVRRTTQRVRPQPVELTGELPQPVPAADETATQARLSWRRTALTATAVLAITLGAVTTLEGVLGKPLAGLLGRSDATGTSIGATVDRGSSTPTRRTPPQEVTPSPAPTPSEEPAASPSATPTDQPTSTPTTTPADEPTPAPTETPTQVPTGDAPAPTAATP